MFKQKVREIPHIKIIRYEESIYYANVENFKYRFMKLAGVNPFIVLRENKLKEIKTKKNEKPSTTSFFQQLKTSLKSEQNQNVKFLLILF